MNDRAFAVTRVSMIFAGADGHLPASPPSSLREATGDAAVLLERRDTKPMKRADEDGYLGWNPTRHIVVQMFDNPRRRYSNQEHRFRGSIQ